MPKTDAGYYVPTEEEIAQAALAIRAGRGPSRVFSDDEEREYRQRLARDAADDDVCDLGECHE